MNPMKKIAEDVVTFNPDGMNINVPWESFVTGASFFLPCINTTEAKKQVTKAFKKRNITIKMVVLIENKRYGVRVWRVL